MQVMVVPVSAVLGPDKGSEKYAVTVFDGGNSRPVEFYDTMDEARTARLHFLKCVEIAEYEGFRLDGECFAHPDGYSFAVAELFALDENGCLEEPEIFGAALRKSKTSWQQNDGNG
jgi:hypothetical protein